MLDKSSVQELTMKFPKADRTLYPSKTTGLAVGDTKIISLYVTNEAVTIERVKTTCRGLILGTVLMLIRHNRVPQTFWRRRCDVEPGFSDRLVAISAQDSSPTRKQWGWMRRWSSEGGRFRWQPQGLLAANLLSLELLPGKMLYGVRLRWRVGFHSAVRRLTVNHNGVSYKQKDNNNGDNYEKDDSTKG